MYLHPTSETPLLDAWLRKPPPLDRDEITQRIEILLQTEGNRTLALIREAMIEEAIRIAMPPRSAS